MRKVLGFLVGVLVIVACECSAGEINYEGCQSLEDVIARETIEIANTIPYDYEELAQLYVSRGESFLLNSQFDKAVEDFQIAYSYIGNSGNPNTDLMVAFRASFGEVVCYDNLGMPEQTQASLEQLTAIASHIGCDDCLQKHPCQRMINNASNTNHYADYVRPLARSFVFQDAIVLCKSKKIEKSVDNSDKQDNYDDIIGPNYVAPGWCEEMVVGVGRAMDAIACMVPNRGVKIALIAFIETFISRGVKCCEAGEFWKSCVAPINRKRREWIEKKEKHILPNEQNLSLFTNRS